MNLQETIDLFAPLDNRSRLELLLTYAEEFPPLSAEKEAERKANIGRVHECQTPVWLWVELTDGRVHIEADAAPEAPTVRGFIALLVEGLNGVTVEEALATPPDFVSRLGLAESLGMSRMIGLNAIVFRILHEIRRKVAEEKLNSE